MIPFLIWGSLGGFMKNAVCFWLIIASLTLQACTDNVDPYPNDETNPGDSNPSTSIIGEWVYESTNGYSYFKFRQDGTFEWEILVISPYGAINTDGTYTKSDETIRLDMGGDTEIYEYQLASTTLTIDGDNYTKITGGFSAPTLDEMLALRTGEYFRAYISADGNEYIVRGSENPSMSGKYWAFGTDGDVTFSLMVDDPFTQGNHSANSILSDYIFTWSHILDYKSYNGSLCEIDIDTDSDGVITGTFSGCPKTNAGNSECISGNYVMRYQ